MVDNEMDDCCFAPDAKTNAARGPTDKQEFETPFEASLRESITERVGPATPPQTGLGNKN